MALIALDIVLASGSIKAAGCRSMGGRGKLSILKLKVPFFLPLKSVIAVEFKVVLFVHWITQGQSVRDP